MNKRLVILASIFVLILFALSACQPPASTSTSAPAKAKAKSGTTLAKVGGEVITLEEFNAKLDKIPPFYKRRVASKKGKLEYLDRLVTEELYYQEALARGMNKDEEFLEQLESIKKSILAGKIKKELMEQKTEVGDPEAKTYYDEHPEEYQSPETVTVNHILFRVKRGDSEDQEKEIKEKAQKVYNEIKSGSISFEDAAKKYSDDKGSAKKGGTLPPIRKGLKSKEFDEVAFAFGKKDEICEPFKDRRGYNILQFVEKADAQPKEYDKVEKQIKRKLAQESQKTSIDSFTEDLRKKYPVSIEETLLVDEEESEEGQPAAEEKAEEKQEG